MPEIFNPERLNITELSIERPEQTKQLPFNPERDITDTDWSRLLSGLEMNRKHNFYGSLAELAADLILLFPDRKDELAITDADKAKMVEEVKLYARNAETANDKFQWRSTLTVAASAYLIDPSWTPAIGINDDFLKLIKLRLMRAREQDPTVPAGLLEQLVSARTLYPTVDFNLTKYEWEQIENELISSRKAKEWKTYGYLAAWVKMLFPDKIQLINLDSTAWKGLRSVLESYRYPANMQEDMAIINFAQQAVDMKILAAEEVNFTPNGLVITIPTSKQPLAESLPDLPQSRKF